MHKCTRERTDVPRIDARTNFREDGVDTAHLEFIIRNTKANGRTRTIANAKADVNV